MEGEGRGRPMHQGWSASNCLVEGVNAKRVWCELRRYYYVEWEFGAINDGHI